MNDYTTKKLEPKPISEEKKIIHTLGNLFWKKYFFFAMGLNFL